MLARSICWVTIDRKRGLALVTGKWHDLLVEQVVPDYRTRWTNAGHGYILSMAEVADLACVADIYFAIYREREQGIPRPHRNGRWITV